VAFQERTYHAEARNLQRLLPLREDVATISKYSFAALALYHALFIRLMVVLKTEDMMSEHEAMMRVDAQSVQNC
jgi:hypothetical protein